MCFRPTAAGKPMECPICGKKVPVIGGVVQKKCPFCKTEFTEDMFKKPDEDKEEK
jgi:phage FluMu protein Com